ncbi:MAG: metallopeptidase TldD-related protein [Bacillota bacterium]|nr:metallopeptidase TldD-related protein [Bacillota bacterium]
MKTQVIDQIRNILQRNDIAAWTITESKSSSLELFLIREHLDMNRCTDIHEFDVRVYVDFEEGGKSYRGDALLQLGASDSKEEMQQKIERAVFSARFVKNPWYDLPVNDPGEYIEIAEFPNLSDLKEKFDAIHRIIYKSYPYASKVNSCEIFAIEGTKRIVTSKGTDVTYPHGEFQFEIVTDSDHGVEPVEIFNGYNLTSVDLTEIERIVDKQLMETDGRSRAVRNEKLESQRVILSGDAVEEFLFFYLMHATDSMIYQNISRAKLGERFLSADAAESLNIRINPALTTSIHARPVDAEGKRLAAYNLYEDGVVKQLRTGAQYSHYLGIPNIGSCSTFEAAGGKQSLAEFTQGDYVEIIAFSSFLMDESTGDFGGEFRLAKQVRNGETRFITGGSISENIFRIQDSMRFSSELEARKYSNAPKAIILDGITVAGE